VAALAATPVHPSACGGRDNWHMDIDYALARQFVDLDGRPRRLRFRRDDTDSADVLSGTGQLIAVIADPRRTDHDDTIAISRTGVEFADVEQTLEGWQHWAMLGDEAVNLVEIQRRIHAAGLD
jgi:hypothetical protein